MIGQRTPPAVRLVWAFAAIGVYATARYLLGR